jgi:hypothetical protein
MSSRPLILLTLLVGCAGAEGVLVLDPPFIEWGEIDFQVATPMGGHGIETVDLWNDGEADLNIWIPSYDQERLCIQGFEGFENPQGIIEIPTLSPGSRAILEIGVCGYLVGDTWSEIGTLVEGRVQLINDGADPVEMLEYSFTPVRDQGD